MLLACHYDLADPLNVEPDAACIYVVMEGYLTQRRVTALERRSLVEALRFGLAFHAGHYLAQADRLELRDMMLRKLHSAVARAQRLRTSPRRRVASNGGMLADTWTTARRRHVNHLGARWLLTPAECDAYAAP